MLEKQNENESKVELDGEQISREQLNEEKSNLKSNERIVEVADQPNKFRKVHRIQG